MARITVEDCLDNVENRFQLVLIASKRARQLSLGSESKLQWENDKPTVLALREIAAGHVDVTILDKKSEEEEAPLILHIAPPLPDNDDIDMTLDMDDDDDEDDPPPPPAL